MATISLDADSTTVILNGFPIDDTIEGDHHEITPVNPATSHINGANGSVNIQGRVDAAVHDYKVRVQAKSPSDIFLNGLLMVRPSTVINGGAKESFTRDGNSAIEAWTFLNGSLTDQPTHIKNNQDGNAVVEYTIRFRTAKRLV